MLRSGPVWLTLSQAIDRSRGPSCCGDLLAVVMRRVTGAALSWSGYLPGCFDRFRSLLLVPLVCCSCCWFGRWPCCSVDRWRVIELCRGLDGIAAGLVALVIFGGVADCWPGLPAVCRGSTGANRPR